MAHTHFLFRLSDKTGGIVLRALERLFLAAQEGERRDIAKITLRLRKKLNFVTKQKNEKTAI